MRNKLSAERGTAIIVALFVMSIAAAMAVAMMLRLQVDIHRTQLVLNAQNAELYAEGSVYWAVEQLNQNVKNQKPQLLVDHTPIVSPENQVRQYHIQSTIYDAQANFNLNSLLVSGTKNDFIRLLSATSPKTSPDIINTIADATVDWLAPDSNTERFRQAYAKASPPYIAAHTPMVSSSELRLVFGMTPEIYTQVIPYVMAFPPTGPNDLVPININSAEAPVLMSLIPNLSIDAAKGIVAYRKATPFQTVDDFLNYTTVKSNAPSNLKDKITVTSNYFLLKTSVTVGQQQTLLYTLLKRNPVGSEGNTTVLWQTKGSL